MSIMNVIELLGGLGAFLFGMHYMGDGLSLAAGAKMKDVLEKLTRNPVLGFIVGMLVTVCIQSSSATTVMVMGFINAGIMDLAQATGVIFGANIGTTITSVLIALDVSALAPVCIAAGACMMLYAKKKRTKYIGQVILGFGLLFQGLHTMSGAMAPLKDSVMFQNFILNATNPLVGFLIGVVLCAIIQSSSAAVGILQALAMQGLMPLAFAGYIVCGINVGSSTPTLISALNAKNNAKRAALIYLIFNVVGALIFVPLTMITPLCQFITDNVASPAFQVSVYHILFKIVTGLILLPLTNLIVKLTYKVLPKQAHENVFRFEFIDKNMVGDTHVLALQVKKEVLRVCKLVRENIETACQSLLDHDISKSKTVYENEEVIDYLTGEITDYLTKNVNTLEMPQEVSDFLSNMFLMINELEQIGDHADKIMSVNERCIEDNLQYSDEAKKEFEIIYKEDLFLYDEVVQGFETGKQTVTREQIRESEHAIAKLSYEAQAHHMDRLKEGICEFDTGLAFTESLNSLSRIANHITAMVEA